MARKNYSIEQIVVKLREMELFCGQGKSINVHNFFFLTLSHLYSLCSLHYNRNL